MVKVLKIMKNERDNSVNDINTAGQGGRRKNGDRRQFAYTFHLPERRSGLDRRAGKDRRKANRNLEEG